MNILVIDTATDLEIVSASRGEEAYNAAGFVDQSHSVTLLDSVQGCLGHLGLKAGDIGIIGVGVGPGSFTGIRIAVTTARMLAQLIRAPLVGLKTHLIYAASAPAQADEYVLVAFDAKKKRVFGALYRKNSSDEVPREIIAPGDYDIRHLIEHIDSPGTILLGSGAEKYHDLLKNSIPGARFLPQFIPDAGKTCRLAAGIYAKDPRLYGDYTRIVPFYARKSDAEIAKDTKKG